MRSSRKFLSGAALVVSTLLSVLSVHTQMVSPSIDTPGQPFSYFSKPTDEIGVMDAEAATEITPEGYLRTGFGELMFFAGQEMEPTDVRIRTLENGRLPIIHYQFDRDGIAYRLTLFTASLNGKSDGTLVNFIRVEMKNAGRQATRAFFATGIRYDALSTTGAAHGDNRFTRPVEGKNAGDYRQPGEVFSRDWTNTFDTGHFYRDDRVLYTFPSSYTSRSYTLRDRIRDMNPPDIDKPATLHVEPETPVGIVAYSSLLQPGSEWSLDFKMPVIPTNDRAAIGAIDDATFDEFKTRVTAFWNGIFAEGMQIDLPEAKAVDTFYANLCYDLIARDHIGSDYIQNVNKLHYHAFYLRDGADIVHSYDVTGYPLVAKQDLEFFAKSQKPDGNFLSQSQQYDGWGEAVWAYAQHYRITRDKEFAEWALPQMVRAVDWLHQARAADPLHIIPASDVRDNEYVPGHLTGYNFLALSGLKLAIQMARETGHADLAAKWLAEYDDYHQAFFKVLDAQTAAHGGYIPPALDGKEGGYDWGNLLAVDYEPILDPHDPRVTATLKATQAKYAEGIMTYADGEFLHHYLTIKNTLTETIRGDQEQAVKEFYAILLHTSSTQAGFEYKIRPWGDRNFGDNLAPHGWFAAEYRTLVRNMLVREDGDRLHLLSVISPAWIGQGRTISVRRAPTNFGTVAFTLEQPQQGAAILHLNPAFTAPPVAIVVHIPWFVTLQSATADGKAVQPANGALTLPPTARSVDLRWTLNASAPHLSYDAAVAGYKAEYARRYEALIHGPAQSR
jgi:hypothetical protein